MQNQIIKYELIDALTETQVISKKTIEDSAKELAGREYSAKEKLVIRTQINALESFLKIVKENLPVSAEELKLTGNVLGADIHYRDSVKYDYKNDQNWRSLDDLKKDREAKLKMQYSLYEKHLKDGGSVEDFIGILEPDGSQIPIIKKNATGNIAITLAP